LAAEQRSSAERSADEARHQQDLAKQEQAKARDAATETQRQEDLAQRQKVLAARAAAEADNQQRLADAQKRLAAKAKSDARREQGNAKLQTQLANAAAARAQAQEELADQQRALAAQWAAEAKQEQEAAAQAAAAAQVAQAKVDQQTRTLVGRRLTDQAKTMITQDPQTALMLGTAADKIENNDDAKRQLAGLVTSTRFAGALPASSAEYAPGSDVAVAATPDGLSLWNMAGPSGPVKLSTLDGAAGQWVWAPTGRTLAVFPKNGAVTLWNVADPAHPARLATLPGLPSVQGVRFSPDGRTLGAYVESLRQVTLWDVSDPSSPRPLSTAVQPVDTAAMAFSPDGHTLVTSGDLNLDVWDVTDPAEPVQVSSMEVDSFYNPTAFSPTRPVLFVSDGLMGGVTVYDLSTPAQPRAIGSLTASEGLTSMAFSPDGQIVVLGDYSSQAVRWNITDPSKPVVIDRLTADDVVNRLSYSRDGRTMIVTTASSATVWSTTDVGTPRAVGQLAGIRRAVVSAYGPGGRSWVAVGPDGTTTVWDLTHPAAPVKRASVKAFDASVYSAAISPDVHTVVATGDYDRDLIRVTDVTDPQKPATLTDIPVDGLTRWEMFNDLRFSADGHLLVATTSSNRMFLYDLTDRSHPRLVAGPIVTDDNSFAFSPDGRTLAGGNPYGGAALWDVSHPSAPVKLVDIGRDRAHVVNGVSVSFSPDGRTLMTEGGSSSTAALWNVTDRLHPVQISTVPAQEATFSPDGRMLLTDNGTGSALWDVSDPAKPLRVGTVDGWPMGLSPDGHSLITGGATLWDFSDLNGVRANPAQRACTVTGRGLTNDEWTMYIPELPYQKTCRE
jgi:WD40 repeat protein